MGLAAIIDRAKRRDAIRPPADRSLLQIRLDGTPTHRMSNAVAACQGELEDAFLRPMEIVSGGAGCLIVEFDLGILSADEERRIEVFLEDEQNLAYFRYRFGITAMTVKRRDRRLS